VKNLVLCWFHVIPAKAGIQSFQQVINTLDPGFHRGDEEKAIFSKLQGMGGEDFKKHGHGDGKRN
jgi:hypothetical protein